LDILVEIVVGCSCSEVVGVEVVGVELVVVDLVVLEVVLYGSIEIPVTPRSLSFSFKSAPPTFFYIYY
jgi:hypothetical protein